MIWYEICRIDYSVYLLFDVIFDEFTTKCVLNLLLIEDPDQSREEPKANLASDYREGKPRT